MGLSEKNWAVTRRMAAQRVPDPVFVSPEGRRSGGGEIKIVPGHPGEPRLVTWSLSVGQSPGLP